MHPGPFSLTPGTDRHVKCFKVRSIGLETKPNRTENMTGHAGLMVRFSCSFDQSQSQLYENCLFSVTDKNRLQLVINRTVGHGVIAPFRGFKMSQQSSNLHSPICSAQIRTDYVEFRGVRACGDQNGKLHHIPHGVCASLCGVRASPHRPMRSPS